MDFFNNELFNKYYKNRRIKIAMLGLDNSGKTTIIEQLKMTKYMKLIPAIGFNHEKVNYKGFKMHIWDPKSWNHISETWNEYLSCHALIFVIDASDQESVYYSSRTFCKLVKKEELRDSIILLLANKKDVANCVTENEIIINFDMKRLVDHEWKVEFISAKNGEGLYESFLWLGEQIQKKFF